MATTKKTKTTSKTPSKSGALWEQYRAKPTPDVLRVLADALVEEGDPRGPFLQLCLVTSPTPEQTAAKEAMIKKVTKKVLAGPGGEYLREIEFGSNGLVARARTEIDMVMEHVDEICQLNPRLVLTITSLKTLKQAQALAKVPLGDIYFVDFSCITGSVDGLSLNDKELEALAPALKNVRHLQLPCRGEKYFTPAGLRLGEHATALRYLAFDYDGTPPNPRSTKYPPPAAEYGAALAEGSFATLRGIDFAGLRPEDVPGRRLIQLGLMSGKWSPDAKAKGVELVDQIDAALSASDT
jgi:hypothetical protein